MLLKDLPWREGVCRDVARQLEKFKDEAATSFYKSRAVMKFTCSECGARIGERCTGPAKTKPFKAVPPHEGRIAKAYLIYG